MEKVLDTALGFIEAIVISGVLGFGAVKGLQVFHDHVRKETIKALKKPVPSLSDFSRQLTEPSR